MFVIQGWVIQLVCMLLMPCKLSYNGAHFLGHLQLDRLWSILKRMIHISNLLDFFLQGGPKKIGISEYKYSLEILQLLKARDKMKDDFGKLVKCRF